MLNNKYIGAVVLVGLLPLVTSNVHATNIYPVTKEEKIKLINQCSDGVHPEVMQAIVSVESTFNPFAIGVVKGNLSRQPRSINEAMQAVQQLKANGKNYSVGLAQVNKVNFNKYGLSGVDIFHPCKNISAGSRILRSCYDGALKRTSDNNQALKMAFSCYYSGNYRTGFTRDFPNQKPYVYKVWDSLLAIQGKPKPKNDVINMPVNQMNREQLAQFANDSLINNQDKAENNSVIGEKNAPHVIQANHVQVVHSWDVFQDFKGKTF